MIDLRDLQKRSFQNKLEKGIDMTDINYAFCIAFSELSDAFRAQHNHNAEHGALLVKAITELLCISELLGLDLENDLVNSIEKSERRRYVEQLDGTFIRVVSEDE